MRLPRYFAVVQSFKIPENTPIKVYDIYTGKSGIMTKSQIKQEIINKHMAFVNAEVDCNNSLNMVDKTVTYVQQLNKGFSMLKEKLENKVPNIEVKKKSVIGLLQSLQSDRDVEDISGGYYALLDFVIVSPKGRNYDVYIGLTRSGYHICSNFEVGNFEYVNIATLENALSITYQSLLKKLRKPFKEVEQVTSPLAKKWDMYNQEYNKQGEIIKSYAEKKHNFDWYD